MVEAGKVAFQELVERAETSGPIEPNLADKHTLYAIAWGIIHLPPQDGQPANHRERVRLKRACRAYAKARGFSLELSTYIKGEEEWFLFPTGWYTMTGLSDTLEAHCLRIVEHDIYQANTSEENNPTA